MTFAASVKKETACEQLEVILIPKYHHTHCFRKPSTTTYFEPTEMPAGSRCAEHGIGVLLEFIEWNGFLNRDLVFVSQREGRSGGIDTHRIVLCVYGEERNADGKHGIR
jgi:hypothetical protein